MLTPEDNAYITENFVPLAAVAPGRLGVSVNGGIEGARVELPRRSLGAG